MKQIAGVAVLALLLGSAGGYLAGRHHPVSPVAQGPSSSSTGISTGIGKAQLSKGTSNPGMAGQPMRETNDAKISTIDLAATLRSLREEDRLGIRDVYRKFGSVNPAEIPELLAAIEKNPSKSVRDSLRSS